MKERPMLTEHEIHIMKHALGWPKCYRNFYAAGGDDIKTCNNLVFKGAMIRKKSPVVSGEVYQVTPSGEKAVDVFEKEDVCGGTRCRDRAFLPVGRQRVD